MSPSSTSTPIPIAPQSQPLPTPLIGILNLKIQAESILSSNELEQELIQGSFGPESNKVKEILSKLIQSCQDVHESPVKLDEEEIARVEFVDGWSRSRIGEYESAGSDQSQLVSNLESALDHFNKSSKLIQLAEPPLLESVPSVTRPRVGLAPLQLKEVQSWVGEMISEWARTIATLAFAKVMEKGKDGVEEDELVRLLEMACRRNVQGERMNVCVFAFLLT